MIWTLSWHLDLLCSHIWHCGRLLGQRCDSLSGEWRLRAQWQASGVSKCPEAGRAGEVDTSEATVNQPLLICYISLSYPVCVQLTVYNYRGGPCYRCIYPVPPPPETVTNCSDGGVLGVGEPCPLICPETTYLVKRLLAKFSTFFF